MAKKVKTTKSNSSLSKLKPKTKIKPKTSSSNKTSATPAKKRTYKIIAKKVKKR